MDRLISLSWKTERDQYTTWKHKHKSDASRDGVGRYSECSHDISICIYTCTEVLCWPFTCSYFRSTSKAFGWYGGWGYLGRGRILPWGPVRSHQLHRLKDGPDYKYIFESFTEPINSETMIHSKTKYHCCVALKHAWVWRHMKGPFTPHSST